MALCDLRDCGHMAQWMVSWQAADGTRMWFLMCTDHKDQHVTRHREHGAVARRMVSMEEEGL